MGPVGKWIPSWLVLERMIPIIQCVSSFRVGDVFHSTEVVFIGTLLLFVFRLLPLGVATADHPL